MAAALEAIPLLALLIFAVLWVLLSTTKLWLEPLLGALHDALGWVPFLGDLVQRADAAIIGALNDGISGLEQGMVDIWAGIVWSWNQFLSANEGFAHALWKSLDHAFSVALPDAFVDARSWVQANLTSLGHRVDSLTDTVRSDIADAERLATAEAGNALAQATRYADTVGTTTYDHAKQYADTAIGTLRDAESAAIANAVSIANTAEHDATAAFDQAKAYAGQLVAPVGAELTQLDEFIKSLGLQTVIAGAAATAALLTQALVDTGLENADCRSKVKGICGTNPAAWENLLAGIAAIGIAFSLQDIVDAANAIFTDASELIQAAA